MHTSNDSSMLTQSDLLSIGWTKSLIDKYLPAPVLKENPIYRSAKPMKLWSKEIVDSIMDSESFKSDMEKSKKRKESSRKAAATKRDNLKQKAEAFAKSINIKILDDEELVQKSISNAYRNYLLHNEFGEKTFKSFSSADQDTIDRWVVNYIRHKLTKYDKKTPYFEGKTGKDEAYILFQNILMDRIAEAYPKYREECECQKKSIEIDE